MNSISRIITMVVMHTLAITTVFGAESEDLQGDNNRTSKIYAGVSYGYTETDIINGPSKGVSVYGGMLTKGPLGFEIAVSAFEQTRNTNAFSKEDIILFKGGVVYQRGQLKSGNVLFGQAGIAAWNRELSGSPRGLSYDSSGSDPYIGFGITSS